MKKNKKIIIIFIIICGSILAFSINKIVKWMIFNNENDKMKEITNNYIMEKDNINYKINFEKLKEINDQTVGFIKIPETPIEYIFVRGQDNEFYLNHGFNKNLNTSGWIFADYRNHIDGKDKNLILYGHNVKDGSMFGSIQDILKNYDNINKEIIIVYDHGTIIYDIFSIYSIKAEEYYLKTEFNSEEEFIDFKKVLKERSQIKNNIDVMNNNDIITLSTCKKGGIERLVLHALVRNISN